MYHSNKKPLGDIEQSIELLSPMDMLKDGGMHGGAHTKLAKWLLVLSLLLLVLSFMSPVFGVLAAGAFCLTVPVTLLGEVWASLASGELRVSLNARRAIAKSDLRAGKFPRVVIRRGERPIRFWFYQGVFVFFGLAPFFIAGLVHFRH